MSDRNEVPVVGLGPISNRTMVLYDTTSNAYINKIQNSNGTAKLYTTCVLFGGTITHILVSL